MKTLRELGMGLVGAGLVVLSCSSDRGRVPDEQSADASVSAATAETALPESGAAATRIAELRARFRLPLPRPERRRPGQAHGAPAGVEAPKTRPALGAPVVTRFESAAGPDAPPQIRAVLPKEALRGVRRRARVALPLRAAGEVSLEDETSHLSLRFALEHAQDAGVEVAGGIALYRGALDGADLLHRVHAEGTEDFVVFETRPAREELSYWVDVSRVPGVRLVSNTLEFLDAKGSPALRVAPPYVVDAKGERHAARLAVSGCDCTSNAGAPSGRPLTKPGAAQCTVRVTWSDVVYPAMVDPAWTATGSMAVPRSLHTATLLASGKVLIAGGDAGTAEIFDPAASGGVGAFAATGAMSAGRWGETATLLQSGKVLLVGGGLSSAEIFDPTAGGGAGAFAPTGSMAAPRREHTATRLQSGKVLVAGGLDTYGVSSAEIFDPAVGAGAFVTTGSMTFWRYGHTASALPSGKVLIVGGYAADAVLCGGSATLFDPAANSGVGAFVPTGSGGAGCGHTATVLPSGKVLIAGGYVERDEDGRQTPYASAMLFDPEAAGGAGAFAATGAMPGERANHTASLLASGKVLVAGGRTGFWGDVLLATSAWFDPSGGGGAGAFTAASPMATPRLGHTSTALPSGKALITGGSGASAELFGQVGSGGTCSVDGDCVSGLCDAGICCLAACPGTCTTCEIGTGACVAVKSADDVDSCTAVNTCDAAGSCKVKTGQACPGGAATCATAQCVDGYCCESACTGGCDTCNAVGHIGVCTPVGPGGPGANPACGVYLCDGVQGACPATCASDAGCAADHYCATDGTCQPRKAQAAPCNAAAGADCKVTDCRVCTTGFCADGVCCNAACTGGTCTACTAALKGQGADGACGPIKDGTDPRSECAPSGVLCGPDGWCNGAGACRNTPAGVSCGSVCQSTVARGQLCNGAGACVANGLSVDCAPYLCSGGSCPTSCVSDAGCAPAHYCATDGTCQPRKAQAAACNTQTNCKAPGCRECTSNFCVDGVCCDTACSGGICQACAAALKQSGVGDGTCGPSKFGVDPHNDCAPTGVLCGADGQCNGTGACRVVAPQGISCGPGVCTGTVARGQLCNGSGTCTTNEAGVECAPFLCSNGGCTTTCATSAACAASAWCSAGTCVPKSENGRACPAADACTSGFCADGVCCDRACTGQCEACDAFAGTCGPITGAPHGARPACGAGLVCDPASTKCEPPPAAATCDGDHTTRGVDGATLDCSPYKCDSAGTCRSTCSSVRDCVAPTVCDSAGKCIPQPPHADAESGCTVAGAGRSSSRAAHLAWAFAMLGLLAARRRRARRTTTSA